MVVTTEESAVLVGGSADRHTCPNCGARVPALETGTGLGRRPGPQLGPRGDELTPRESAVLDLLTEGLTDRQIGRRLGISPRTVDTHLGRAYTKLGVHGRVAASTRWLLRPPVPQRA
ncbi:MAG: hypothetical protein GEU93_19930 [Propionibacteriales bacterium]|nr:hypothetical protein [Propionibacteriales bacterium]